MATIFIPTIMRKMTDGKAEVEVAGHTLAHAFEGLEQRFPALTAHLRGTTGTMPRHIRVFVNSDDVTPMPADSVSLRDNDEVLIIPAMAGG